MNDRMANLCECVLSVVTVTTSSGFRLCANVDGRQPPLVSAGGDIWERCFDEDMLGVYYLINDAHSPRYRYPRPLAPVQHDSGRRGPILGAPTDPVLHIRGAVATLLVSDQHSRAASMLSPCREGVHTHCHLQLHDSANRVVGFVLVDGGAVPDISGSEHRFLALSRSTLYRLDDDPSWDPKTKAFRPWTHPESGAPGSEDKWSESDEDVTAVGLWRPRSEGTFDQEEFDPRVFWPIVRVLMLSRGVQGEVVERVGVGKVHVNGFMPIATEEDVLLG